MKAKLTFDLSDPDDRISHLQAVHASDMACVLFEIANNLKKKAEWHADENPTADRHDMIEWIFQQIHDELNASNINTDQLCP